MIRFRNVYKQMRKNKGNLQQQTIVDFVQRIMKRVSARPGGRSIWGLPG